MCDETDGVGAALDTGLGVVYTGQFVDYAFGEDVDEEGGRGGYFGEYCELFGGFKVVPIVVVVEEYLKR